MKPKRKEGEGLYYFYLYDTDVDKITCREYIRSIASWFTIARRYENCTKYIFVADIEVESYLALAFNLRKDCEYDIPAQESCTIFKVRFGIQIWKVAREFYGRIMHTDLIVTTPMHAPVEYSLYRLRFPAGQYDRLMNILSSIRPDDSKLMLIDPGSQTTRIHVILSEEELLLLSLSIKMKHNWLQQWEYK